MRIYRYEPSEAWRLSGWFETTLTTSEDGRLIASVAEGRGTFSGTKVVFPQLFQSPEREAQDRARKQKELDWLIQDGRAVEVLEPILYR